MVIVMLAAPLLALAFLFASFPFQAEDPVAQLPQGLPTGAPGTAAKKWVSVDGKEATPGRIPVGTSEGALKLWNEVLAASRIQKAAGPTPPVKSFDLTFEVRLRSKPGVPSNDESVNFRFLDQAQGFLSAEFLSSHRLTLRGPKGDHLFDGKDWVSLAGREDEESRRELNRWVAIARNFVALTQPAAVRLIDLRELKPLVAAKDESSKPSAPQRIEFGGGRFVSIPNAKLHKASQGLRWLEVTSPDFRLFDSGKRSPGASAAYRSILGLDSKGRVRMAQFHGDHGGAVQLQGALFVEIQSWKELPNGYVLPREINTFRSDAGKLHAAFEVQPSLALWLLTRSARINPENPPLTKAHFLPRK